MTGAGRSSRGKGGDDIVTRVTTNFSQSGELPPPLALSALAESDPLPAGTVPQITKVAGPGELFAVPMRESMVMLGRAEGVAEIVLDDDRASRYHACIVHRGGKFFLYDMGSRNGTRLNDAFVSKAEIVSGDRITIGASVLLFEVG